jgi:hypothetical protein
LKSTELLAFYGAILSTIVFAWNISRAIPRIKVEIVFGLGEIEGKETDGVLISVQNPSPHTVHLVNISILYRYRNAKISELFTYPFKYRKLPRTVGWASSSLSDYNVEDGCPLALEPGKSHNVFVSETVLNEMFDDGDKNLIRAAVQDQLWRTKYSPKLEYS